LHFTRRCAKRLTSPAADRVQVTIERQAGRHRVQLRVADTSTAVEALEENALLAIRNAFDHLASDPRRLAGRSEASAPPTSPAGAVLTARRRRLLELAAALDITAAVLLDGERDAREALDQVHARFDDAAERWLRLESAWLRRLERRGLDPAPIQARRERVAGIACLLWGLRQRRPGSPVELALAVRHLVSRVEAYLHGLELAWLTSEPRADGPTRCASRAVAESPLPVAGRTA
jgi:hypothetical protein